jgi:hypothetical protein
MPQGESVKKGLGEEKKPQLHGLMQSFTFLLFEKFYYGEN